MHVPYPHIDIDLLVPSTIPLLPTGSNVKKTLFTVFNSSVFTITYTIKKFTFKTNQSVIIILFQCSSQIFDNVEMSTMHDMTLSVLNSRDLLEPFSAKKWQCPETNFSLVIFASNVRTLKICL